MDYADPAQLEAFLLQRIKEKTEKDKLDLKRDLTGWDSKADKEAQMNLIRLVSAFANTSTDEFDDYGFLIYGADKADGDITNDVAVLRTKGSDKLHAEMGQQLARYLFPVPRFEVYDFHRDEKTWGAVVIEPMAQGPAVFIRESSYWRVGEWRVRRGARTEMPTADDYRRMQQGWTAPLEQQIRLLERGIATARGELQAKAEAAIPSIKVGPSEFSVQLKDPDAEVRRNWRVISASGELQMLVSKIHTAPRTQQLVEERAQEDQTPTEVQIGLDPGSSLAKMILQQTSYSYDLFGPKPFEVSKDRVDKLLEGLKQAGISVDRKDYDFPSLQIARSLHQLYADKWSGEDLERFEWFCKLERTLPEWQFHRTEAKKLANCLEFSLAFQNDGPVPVDDLTIEVSAIEGNAISILEALPYHGEYKRPDDDKPSWMRVSSFDLYPSPSGPAHVTRVHTWARDLKGLRPSDEAILKIPIQVLKLGTADLRIKVKGRNLPTPLLYSFQVHVHAKNVGAPHP